ncbi:hypothetical protein VKT23_012889 [Stygiomarasmius scandens]|uniref:RRM domain-containing protein n=1 Tax=Marasmiellus scandens TaxID=2682957 RepID=A0ABR1J9J6_9AGAR
MAKCIYPPFSVEEAAVVTDPKGDSRLYGFVTMSSVVEAEKAMKRVHGSSLGGQIITVTKVHPSLLTYPSGPIDRGLGYQPQADTMLTDGTETPQKKTGKRRGHLVTTIKGGINTLRTDFIKLL